MRICKSPLQLKYFRRRTCLQLSILIPWASKIRDLSSGVAISGASPRSAQLNLDGRAEMVLGRIAFTPNGDSILTDWRVLASGMPVRWEKNWMPQVIGDELRC
ncbi:MAG TPA: hypothetical protein VGK90_02410 [Rhizomicrobium sp.]|jgi:hypothetical protein